MKTSSDLFSPFFPLDSAKSVLADPYPYYRRARVEDPIHFSECFNAWFITRYSDVLQALRNKQLSSRRAGTKFTGLSEELREACTQFKDSLAQWMVFMDPPVHTAVRARANKFMSAVSVEPLRPRIETIVNGLLDKVESRGSMDLIHDLASPLPRIIAAEILSEEGMPCPQLKDWCNEIASFVGSGAATPERTDRAVRCWRDMSNYLRDVIAQHRKNPRSDLISLLLAPDASGNLLPEETALATCVVLLVGAHEATQDVLCLCMLALLRNRRAMQQLQDSPSLITTAVEELVRYDSPVQVVGRKAASDVVMGGKHIRKDEVIFLVIGAANRDPDEFSQPDQIDFDRKANRHLGFGLGHHLCVGAPLGRVEAQIAINTALKRMPGMRLTGEMLDWKANLLFRGVRSLPVDFS